MARAFLLIADIGGYTRFMKVHRINLAHAQYVVARLLEAVIDGAGRRLRLAKLEGDAAFFYLELPGADAPSLDAPRQAIAAIRRAFVARQAELVMDRVCACDGCTQAGDLTLKFVAHVGEVGFQRVKRLRELAGVDVIVVHRLLKNAVPLPEYLLMTPAVFAHVDGDLAEHAVELEEELEGLGRTPVFYVDAEVVAPRAAPARAPSWLRRWWGWLRMTVRSIPYFIGARQACDGFRNASPIFDAAPPPARLPRSEP
ncbi:MAG: DUF2652 domain-containing protein [Kofleriaceae bacterium]